MIKAVLLLTLGLVCSGCMGSLFPPKIQGGKADMQIEKVEKIEPSKTNEKFIIRIKEKK